MTNRSRDDRRRQRPWLTRRRVICIVLLLLVAGYIQARPTLENWLGVDLPALVDSSQNGNTDAGGAPAPGETDAGNEGNLAEAPPSSAPETGPSSFTLKPLGDDRWQSPAGLIYEPGPQREHRIDHVMRHARDDPDRPIHGVFSANQRDELLALLDRAWTLAREESPSAQHRRSDGRDEWTIEMAEPVGYVGGKEGRDAGYPPTSRMKLVLEGDRVITAYPTWP